MAEFKISRLRYNWRGNWAAATVYNKDDVVNYAGSSWYCIRQHTSSTFVAGQNFYASITDTSYSPAFAKMTDGFAFSGSWQANNPYVAGEIVESGGTLYICTVDHQSSTFFATNILNWDVFATTTKFVGDWQPATRFTVGSLVRYNGTVYQCILEHTSGTTSEGIVVGNNDDINDSTAETWRVVFYSVEYRGDHAAAERYRLNDFVKYGATIFRCIEEHTSSSSLDHTKFTTEFQGQQFAGEWTNNVHYGKGDIVKTNGYVYICDIGNINSEPGYNDANPLGNTNWILLDKAINVRGNWSSSADYKAGDLVKRGGILYIAKTDILNDGSSLDYLETSLWEVVVPGKSWRGEWDDAVEYNEGDVVSFYSSIYECNFYHTSTNQNFPGDNGNGYAFWNLLVQGDEFAGLKERSDLLTFNLSRGLQGDSSTLGPTRIPTGNLDEVLTVQNSDGDIYYKVWGTVTRVFHVSATNGIDDITDPDRGQQYWKPWKTIRFAAEQADDGYTGTTTISVRTGLYEEILPIILPAKTAVCGEELRSTTITAAGPVAALANDASYTVDVLLRFIEIIPDMFAGTTIVKSIGNTAVQVTSPTSTQSSLVVNLLGTMIDYIRYHVLDIGSDPAVTGSLNPLDLTATANLQIANAINLLEANIEFLAEEAVAFTAQEDPSYAFDGNLCKRDVRRFLAAILYDIEYPGTYKSILAARYYSNAVIGSFHEDMFYCRDSTGLRNCTLKGLVGTLPEPVGEEVFSRPTGGSYVSLDPGWGPNDQRVWITTRSPYVQNVTTFGYGAVGQKIDGDLHNGGNKSIVSNDFTQVISDGIGAYVLNGGRAELVSVFTYYAYIGMFAEDGGIIRATNGNSSYGTYGAMAKGNDPDETVQFGKINARNSQAVVASALAGEVNDYILILEFENAGQQYTTANYSIVGSGTSASAFQEEIRDKGVFTIDLLSGGTTHVLRGNNANSGNTTTITLATSDDVTEAEILGTRIIITSGEGTGQYGYVQAYNEGTKVLTVYRESDDQPGWDHVIPGTPSVAVLTTSSRYRFEPRPIFSHPGFTATQITLGTANSWSGIAFGDWEKVYAGVSGTAPANPPLGGGITATFNVTKTGTSYTIAIANAGLGYVNGQTIVLDGDDVGGVIIENDITITVTGVTLTGVITGITHEGIASSGRFVAVTSSGNAATYSIDGDTWFDSTLPSSGNWKSIAYGENRFVAVRSGSNAAAYSTDGDTWVASTLPASRNWNSVVYGQGVFVAVAGDSDSAAISQNGSTWTSSTLPDVGDSTQSEWVDIAYGNNRFVAIANSSNAIAVGIYNSIAQTISWSGNVLYVGDSSQLRDWTSITYGNGRFVAVSRQGDAAYSFTGYEWYYTAGGMPNKGPVIDATNIVPGTTYIIETVGTTDYTSAGAGSNTVGIVFVATQAGSAFAAGTTGTVRQYFQEFYWKQVRYGQGVFMAVGSKFDNSSTDLCATSYDGIVWQMQSLANQLSWSAVGFGTPDINLGDSTVTSKTPMWIIAPGTSSTNINKIRTGARALGRIEVEGGQVRKVKLWEPGSGYQSPPTITLVDPNNTLEAYYRVRIADGVLAQPNWTNRGLAYKTSTTTVSVTGDGFADITPTGRFITVDGLTTIPGPGSQFYIGGRETYFTVVVTGLEVASENGTLRSTFQISPELEMADYIQDDQEVQIRERYSQVRITGHDFLDVGTGNFVQTNYPELYIDYNYEATPSNEVAQFDGGRVFYTSTDQDGNFRAGELFAVEQATGIVTISADFFDLQGLTELALGGVIVGGTGTVVREFSTDPLFTQNSNNVVPTQRAIVSYLQSRLNIGGEDLLTPSITAGTVRVGPNLIESTVSGIVNIPVIAQFSGAGSHISGSMLAQSFFYRSFKDDGQTI